MDEHDFLDDVGGRQKLPDLTPGQYTLKLLEFGKGKTKKGLQVFWANVEILESSGDEALPAKTTGTVRIYQDEWGYYKKEIPALVAAVLDEPMDKVTGSLIRSVLADQTAVKGVPFRFEKNGPKRRFFSWTPNQQNSAAGAA